MIYGIGVDCVKVERIAKSMEKPRFAGGVFSGREQEYLESLPNAKKNESAAACFAAKEAFLKAAGVGLGGFSLPDVAALRHKTGAPYYELCGTAAEYVKKHGLTVHLSITHENGLAIAFAVAERA